MRQLPSLALVCFLALPAVSQEAAKETAKETPRLLAAGDLAPAFSMPGSDGKTHTLAEHAGKRVVVVAWFPKVFTGG